MEKVDLDNSGERFTKSTDFISRNFQKYLNFNSNKIKFGHFWTNLESALTLRVFIRLQY